MYPDSVSESGFRFGIRIQIQNPDSGSESGSGSRRAKMTHKNRKKVKKFHVLKSWMFPFEGWRLLLQLGRPLCQRGQGISTVSCNFWWKKNSAVNFLQSSKPWIRIGFGSRVAGPERTVETRVFCLLLKSVSDLSLILTTWNTLCVVSKTPGREVLLTRTSDVVGSHRIVCMSAVYLSAGFPPVLSWYLFLFAFFITCKELFF